MLRRKNKDKWTSPEVNRTELGFESGLAGSEERGGGGGCDDCASSAEGYK